MTEQRISRKMGKDAYEGACRIYFIEAVGMDRVKIGYTVNPARRFVGMLTSSPAPLSLLGCMPGGPQKEAQLHAQLAEHRLHGEWFRMVPAVMAVVAGAETIYGQEFYNQVARQRGAGLGEYLAKMRAGEVVRPTRGKLKRPRLKKSSRYDWSPEDPLRKTGATP